MTEIITGFGILSFWALAIILCLYLFLLPVILASRKGASRMGFFLLCFIAWPLALIWTVFLATYSRYHDDMGRGL